MACVHLQQLYELCQDNELKLSASDLIRVTCHKCGEKEVCPSVLTDEYDSGAVDAIESNSQVGESTEK